MSASTGMAPFRLAGLLLGLAAQLEEHEGVKVDRVKERLRKLADRVLKNLDELDWQLLADVLDAVALAVRLLPNGALAARVLVLVAVLVRRVGRERKGESAAPDEGPDHQDQ